MACSDRSMSAGKSSSGAGPSGKANRKPPTLNFQNPDKQSTSNRAAAKFNSTSSHNDSTHSARPARAAHGPPGRYSETRPSSAPVKRPDYLGMYRPGARESPASGHIRPGPEPPRSQTPGSS